MAYEIVLPSFSTKEIAEDVRRRIAEQNSHLVVFVREEKVSDIKNKLQKIIDEI